MKKHPVLLLSIFLLTATALQAEEVIFNPPFEENVKNTARVGGASRGVGKEEVSLRAIEPILTGLTLKEQPTLYWYISDIKNANVELTLTVDETISVEPVLEKQLTSPGEAGIYSIDLKEHNIKLKQGVDYFWAVSIIIDPNQRSKDIITGGGLKFINAPAELATKLRNAKKDDRFSILARNGIWYDAIEEISRNIKAQPLNKALRDQRASLLSQMKITEAADYDKKR